MRVGYVRCSTAEQNESRQDFKTMMAFVRAGDTVIVESISRIARNTRDLLTIISSLTEKGVEFVSLKENIDTTTPHGRFTLTVFGALADWSGKASWSVSMRGSRSQRLKVSTKGVNLWQSMKLSSVLFVPAGVLVRLRQRLQCMQEVGLGQLPSGNGRGL